MIELALGTLVARRVTLFVCVCVCICSISIPYSKGLLERFRTQGFKLKVWQVVRGQRRRDQTVNKENEKQRNNGRTTKHTHTHAANTKLSRSPLGKGFGRARPRRASKAGPVKSEDNRRCNYTSPSHAPSRKGSHDHLIARGRFDFWGSTTTSMGRVCSLGPVFIYVSLAHTHLGLGCMIACCDCCAVGPGTHRARLLKGC